MFGPRLKMVKVPDGYPRAGRLGHVISITSEEVEIFVSKPVEAARRSKQSAVTVFLPRDIVEIAAL